MDTEMLAEQKMPKLENSNITEKSTKKRRKRKKPNATNSTTTQTVICDNNIENLPATTTTVLPVASNNKSKRKRNKKKSSNTTTETSNTTTQNEIKIENLISKTFQDSRRNSANQITDQIQKDEKEQEQKLLNGITSKVVLTKTTKSNQNKTETSSKALSNCVNEKITMDKEQNFRLNNSNINNPGSTKTLINNETVKSEKSREEILAERKAKKLAKQANKNKNPVNEIFVNDPKEIIAPETKVTNKIVESSQNVIENKINPTISQQQQQQKLPTVDNSCHSSPSNSQSINLEKSREQILAEREAKKLAKQAAKNKSASSLGQEKNTSSVTTQDSSTVMNNKNVLASSADEVNEQGENKKKQQATKAERRAIQEAQREAKAKLLAEKQQQQKQKQQQQKQQQQKSESSDNVDIIKTKEETKDKSTTSTPTTTSLMKLDYRVKLFNHLYGVLKQHNLFVNNPNIHPIMVQLGEKYSKRIIVGANARCTAFLNAVKTVIREFETPPKKEFSRVLETNIKNCVEYLQNCRPLAVSVVNAHKYIKFLLTQLPADQPESKLKEHLLQCIDDYIKDQIEKAAQAINSAVQEKISNGDVILVYGCSSLINHILDEALNRNVNFRVVVVDSRPFHEGQEMLRRLVKKGISCTSILINAISYIMSDVTKVLLGAHGILANGYVMSRTGTAQISLVARSHNVPVLICCETHKFSERVQTDAIVYNELCNPDEVLKLPNDHNNNLLKNWRQFDKLSPLNINYDITPPELITAVVTEVAILPCTSVPVILRIKPTEIGY